MRITSQSDLTPPYLLLWIKNKYFYETFPWLIFWLKQLDFLKKKKKTVNFAVLVVDANGTEITNFTLNVYFLELRNDRKAEGLNRILTKS